MNILNNNTMYVEYLEYNDQGIDENTEKSFESTRGYGNHHQDWFRKE